MSIFIYYSENRNSPSPGFGLNPMNSKQAQTKLESRVSLLRPVHRCRSAINLGRKQSQMGGRDATGMAPNRIPGN